MESPISSEELNLAIKQMKVGKSPGPDGLPLLYYKCFLDELAPKFLQIFNSLSSPHVSLGRMLEAYIAVIPKEGKDPLQVSNYRPISLLNVDRKLYAKILANRLLPLIPGLISSDQVGFIPGREARDNTIRTLNLHHQLTSSGTKGFLLSLDAEKAFDRVAWDYMREVLKGIGLLPRMFTHINTLYTNPSARVKTNGLLSNAFSISNRTRQGCPLSPLIFVLTLEPLLNKMQSNTDIKGISLEHREFKVAAFADEILLSLQTPQLSLPNLLKDIKHFGELSNLKINYSKSHALKITLTPQDVFHCQDSFPFQWKTDAIKIIRKLTDLYSQNFLPIPSKIQADLKEWANLNVSWFGRWALIKMVILSP